MSFFNQTEPLLRCKQTALDIQDLRGLLRIHWRIGPVTLLSTAYTRIDQVFVLWSLITATIFTTAQFLPIGWDVQAIVWSCLTVIGAIAMEVLTRFWVKVERLRWVVYFWIGLMLLGVALTDLGVFCGWAMILTHLCPLWLGLMAIGYLGTGLGMQSRTFLVSGLLHLLALLLIPYASGWQFLMTGCLMSSSLLMLAEMQWDMRPPLESKELTLQEREFNRRQHQLRHSVT